MHTHSFTDGCAGACSLDGLHQQVEGEGEREMCVGRVCGM